MSEYLPRGSGHRWSPIEDLPDGLRDSGSRELDALVVSWRSQLDALGDAPRFHEFQRRLVRDWSIETGILENLYKLGEAVALALVEQGFDAALISSTDTDLDPQALIEILHDHQNAAEGLFAFVKQRRELSTSYIKELHVALTAHQATCDAVDSLGQRTAVPLLRGQFKTQPNNPGDPSTGEAKHEYCPPEHTEAEMDRLISMHRAHEDVPYEVEAAWLHHRFTQIHPFQDGNGRVARALATLICLRAYALPLVVDRTDKHEYIKALEAADDGDLRPLVRLFQRLQKLRLLRALSLSEEAAGSAIDSGVGQIIASAREKVDRAAQERVDASQAHATRLNDISFARLGEVASQLIENRFKATVFACGPETGHYFRSQIIDVARHFEYYANLGGTKLWTHLRIGDGPTFHFVVSIHHMGRIQDGVMAVTAFSFQKTIDDEDSVARFSAAVSDCPSGPFTFTADREEKELGTAFREWLDPCIAVGLARWQKGV